MGFVTKLLEEYSKLKPELLIFTNKTELLVKDLLSSHGINVHSISSRIKDDDSLEKKILDTDCKYDCLESITDLSGIRIITYFEDEVDKVSKIIKDEFEIDGPNSIDKRQLMEPDRFGYLSLHYVCSLSKKRAKLPEYKKYEKLKTEIQIRSILQHAWAEMEHDLGYKSESLVPKDIKRRFSRLAGLLELADTEFMNIRTDLDKYSKLVSKAIEDKPETLLIDKVTVNMFLRSSESVSYINKKISDHVKAKIGKYDTVDILVQKLKYIDLTTIKDLKDIVDTEKDNIANMANAILGSRRGGNLNSGISLFYLCYYELAKSGDPRKIVDYLEAMSPGKDTHRERFAKLVIDKYNQIIE